MSFLFNWFRDAGRGQQQHETTHEEKLYTTLACHSISSLSGLDFRNPTPALRESFAQLAAETIAALMSDHGVRSQTFASMILFQAIAHRYKPYGTGTSADIDAIYAAATLDCSNYGILTHHIAEAILGYDVRISVAFVGWDGGAIGNHQTVFVRERDSGESLFLDPTVGLAALANYDHVASGRPVDPAAILAISPAPQLQSSREQVARALRDGSFRPSDLLYYFEGIDHFLNRFGSVDMWPTPGAVVCRERFNVDSCAKYEK